MLFQSPALHSVSFEIDPNDLIDSSYRISLSPTQQKARWKTVLIVTLACTIGFRVAGEDTTLLTSGLTFLAIFAVASILFIGLNRGKNLRRIITKNLDRAYPGGLGAGGIVGERTLTIYENGIGLLTDSTYSEDKWSSLQVIFLLEDAIVIFNTPATLHEIPKTKLGAPKFAELSNLLKEKAPPQLLREKFDYPI